MIKKLFIAILLIAIILWPSVASGAAGNIKVTGSSTRIDFPVSLSFNLKAESSSNISRVRLRYEVDKMTYAPTFAEFWPEFAPGKSVAVRHTWDMRKGSMPHGAKITYWWVVEDSAGNSLVTPRETISYDDTRYKWQKISDGKVAVSWYEGNRSFAEDLLKASVETIERQARDTGAYLEKPVNLYIYGNYRDLRGSLVATEEWTGGVAYAGFNIISIGISPNNLQWGKKAVAHELGHLVVHHITFSPYGSDLPPWLDEGLAMHAESQQSKADHEALVKAIEKDNVYTLRSLSSPFSADPEEAYFSYAQSQSVVEFLIDKYGKDKLNGLLILMRDGYAMDDALNRIYGFDLSGLNEAWMKYMMASSAAK